MAVQGLIPGASRSFLRFYDSSWLPVTLFTEDYYSFRFRHRRDERNLFSARIGLTCGTADFSRRAWNWFVLISVSRKDWNRGSGIFAIPEIIGTARVRRFSKYRCLIDRDVGFSSDSRPTKNLLTRTRREMCMHS